MRQRNAEDLIIGISWVCLVLTMALLLLGLVRDASAQNTRDFIDGEFIGLETTFVYKDAKGQVKAEPYKTRIGRLRRGIEAFPFTNLASADLNTIPTAGLAAEHWWLSFELLMIAQRDYGACVAAVNEHHRRLGLCALDNPACSPYAGIVFIIRDYWVPFNIVWDGGVPSRETYIAHIEAGMSSLNQALAHRDACRGYLYYLRTR